MISIPENYNTWQSLKSLIVSLLYSKDGNSSSHGLTPVQLQHVELSHGVPSGSNRCQSPKALLSAPTCEILPGDPELAKYSREDTLLLNTPGKMLSSPAGGIPYRMGTDVYT
jgi:hypothetical protein